MSATQNNSMPVKKVVVDKPHSAAAPVVKEQSVAPPAAPPALRPDYLKKAIYIMVPVSIIAFLIISISLTFGQSDAGIAMGVLEGCLILVVGLLVVFFAPIKAFFQKTFGRYMPSRKNKKGGEQKK